VYLCSIVWVSCYFNTVPFYLLFLVLWCLLTTILVARCWSILCTESTSDCWQSTKMRKQYPRGVTPYLKVVHMIDPGQSVLKKISLRPCQVLRKSPYIMALLLRIIPSRGSIFWDFIKTIWYSCIILHNFIEIMSKYRTSMNIFP